MFLVVGNAIVIYSSPIFSYFKSENVDAVTIKTGKMTILSEPSPLKLSYIASKLLKRSHTLQKRYKDKTDVKISTFKNVSMSPDGKHLIVEMPLDLNRTQKNEKIPKKLSIKPLNFTPIK